MSRAALWVAGAALLAALPSGSPAVVACPPVSGGARLVCGLSLDLNAASAEDLEVLPGVGPVRAQAIAQARPFATLGDVTHVPGVGPRTLEGIAPWVELGNAWRPEPGAVARGRRTMTSRTR